MIELPEALTIASQLNERIRGKQITKVIAAFTPHKLTWYHGDPQGYHALLTGKTVAKAQSYGGMVEIKAGNACILFNDGVGLRFHAINESRPQKHQLLVEFEDATAISAVVQMYGGICSFIEGGYDNPYYKVAKEKPSPLTADFNVTYFERIITAPEVLKLSAKAFLATEQRIPGLGNGVLQDILYNAQIHPKQKINALSDNKKEALYNSVKSTLAEMANQGGRDTEKDLYGLLGGYQTKLCKNTAGKPCLICGGMIKKENYLGGSIYFCIGCQKV